MNWVAQPKVYVTHRLISPEPNTGCWLWLGTINDKGYGSLVFNLHGRRTSRGIHRIVYETYKGPIPAGLQLDHLCRTPCCVNPDHLEAVTSRENVIREFNSRPQRTHCVAGHELTPENTWTYRGRRVCRECKRVKRRAYYNEHEAAP